MHDYIISYTRTARWQQHQIELRALTNVAFIQHPAVFQHIVLEDQSHPSNIRRRNDPVHQDGFQDQNPMIALQLGDLITFSSNGLDHNSELVPDQPVPRRHGEVKLCKLELLLYRPCACLSKGLCSRCRNMLTVDLEGFTRPGTLLNVLRNTGILMVQAVR